MSGLRRSAAEDPHFSAIRYDHTALRLALTPKAGDPIPRRKRTGVRFDAFAWGTTTMTYSDLPGRLAARTSTRISVVAFLTVLAVTLELHALEVLTVQDVAAVTGIGLLASATLCMVGRMVRRRI